MDLDVWGTLSFRRLAHFVAVVEAGTISGAAEGLFMSQSAVAGSVTELERALEADLLIRRRGRGVTLTPTGAEVLGRARSLLAGAAELNDLAHGHGSELAGPLAVGCFVTLAPTVLPRLLVEFEARHPRVTISFHEGSQDALQEQLLAGQLDVAVMYDMDLTASLNRVVLYEPRAYALFGAGHPFAAQPSVTLEQLAPEPLILFDTTPSTSYAMSLFEGRGLQPNGPPPHARLRAHALPRRAQPRVLRDPRAAAGAQAELRGAAHHRARARAGGAPVPGGARVAAGQQAVAAGARARGDRSARLRLVGTSAPRPQGSRARRWPTRPRRGPHRR